MKIGIFKWILIVGVLSIGMGKKAPPPDALDLMDFDLVFQDSYSSQSEAVRAATKSKFSHVGILWLKNGQPWVFEAVQPVKMTPLDQWRKRDPQGRYAVKRLKDRSKLSRKGFAIARAVRQGYLGKSYDLAFAWDDEKLYCSELVWKMYRRAFGIELCETKKLGDFDLSNPKVRAKVAERYGNQVPMEETVVSPQDLWESGMLVTVRGYK